MSIETEVKIKLKDSELEDVRKRLQEMGATLKVPATKEHNLLFDYPDKQLEKTGKALRLRRYGEENLLTFKGATEQDPHLKRRPEVEVKVSSFEKMRGLLTRIGLERSFIYDKVREKYETLAEGQPVEITIDQTSVGNFVEIEGDPDLIHPVARRFGWHRDRFSRENYVDLFKKDRQQEGGE